ncbi:hypothetical protein Pan216_51620 [Planctomycetes bacterium Pan216]|uniref:Uncharacterized protein n=1 Tax=Kolteria novifilia TaxID=2527975 RepID=A0A518BBK6_9BACT|nr:hypothetical protein Pan216_51620 [Planctomycetes bacterium Pan216]
MNSMVESRLSLAARQGLGRLAERPGLLFLTLLLVHSLFTPYVGIRDDAELYALQVQHHLHPGVYGNDIYLKFGSQDSYSAFSTIVTPIAASLGVPTAFFLVYFLSTSLLVYFLSTSLLVFACMRLTRVILSPPSLAVVAAILLVVVALPYGGWHSHDAQEDYLTPRIPAAALGLLGVVAVIERRYVRGWCFTLAAMAVHPLIGVSVLAVVGGATLLTCCSWRWLLSSSLLAGWVVAYVLANQSLGLRLFGRMDADWMAFVVRTSPNCFPTLWSWPDWLRVTSALLVLLLGLTHLRDQRRRVVALVLAVACAGLSVSVVAEYLPYALLLQGQAFRAVWLAQYLSIPVGVLAMVERWRFQRPLDRIVALAVGIVTTRAVDWWQVDPRQGVLLVAIFALTSTVLAFSDRGKGETRTPQHRRFLLALGLACLVVSAFGVLTVGSKLFAHLPNHDPVSIVLGTLRTKGQLIVASVSLGIGIAIGLLVQRRSGVLVILAPLALLVGCWPFLVQQHQGYAVRYERDASDLAFVSAYLANRERPSPRATEIYWPTWPTVLAYRITSTPIVSFASDRQFFGVIFNRGTATEAQRRAVLVRPFENDSMLDICCHESFWSHSFRIFGADTTPPTIGDFQRLCAEPSLEVVILRQRFGDQVAASNGHVHIYECHAIRNPDQHLAQTRSLESPFPPLGQPSQRTKYAVNFIEGH